MGEAVNAPHVRADVRVEEKEQMEMREIIKIIEENGLKLHLKEHVEHFVYLIEEYVREECAKICDRVEDELRDDDQVSAAGGAWRCGFEIRERARDFENK